MAGKVTPVMRQHAEAKGAYPDAVIFFRLGDFYEMFGADAVLCAEVLKLTLTSRNRGKPDEIPMAGVPHHAAHSYIGRMLRAGHRVAICEQMADPKMHKGIVPRAVVRVLTPGLVTAEDHLCSSENNWLAALVLDEEQVGVALLDISTGELRAASADNLTAMLGELCRAKPKEILLTCLVEDSADAVNAARASITGLLPDVSIHSEEALAEEAEVEALKDVAEDAARLDIKQKMAVAQVLAFAMRCNPGVALPVRSIGSWDPQAGLAIDPNAQRHLELVESNTGNTKATLLSTIDQTATAAGARMLRRRLLAPLTDIAQIRRRQDAVELFLMHAGVRSEARACLRGFGDIERIGSRVVLGQVSPKELGALRDSLLAASELVDILTKLDGPEAREAWGLSSPPDLVEDVASELHRALVERPPALAKEGQIFLDAHDKSLAEFSDLKKNGSERIVELEARLRGETEISALRVKYTRVFGWYVEVSRSSVKKVPKGWRRKQTVANGERYTLEELDELAEHIAQAEEQHRSRELELMKTLNELVRAAAERLRALSRRVAGWDVASALAEVAHRFDYVRPTVDDSFRAEVIDGRHPVVERLAARGRFVPNDLSLDATNCRLWMLTGPNMAGKSTFLRQVALCVILAQMGSFVPAKSAKLGVFDRVLSRVGASDNLAQGDSTFMVEMRETAEILRSATPRSLVILDEIGRGTSTFDGLSIAWAVAEHLDEVSRCRALFATHYHELTQLAEESPTAANYSVSARERDGDIVFLHRLIKGAASRSYGVAVAKLAGLPEAVLARARALLASLEDEEVAASGTGRPTRRRRASDNSQQLALFGAPAKPTSKEQEVLDTLRAVELERLAPLAALQLLAKLKKRL